MSEYSFMDSPHKRWKSSTTGVNADNVCGMNTDLISRDALKKAFNKWWGCDDIPATIVEDLIDDAPTVDIPTEICKTCRFLTDCETCEYKIRPQVEWQVDGALIACNKCGNILLKVNHFYNYCPNCGEKMQKGGAV